MPGRDDWDAIHRLVRHRLPGDPAVGAAIKIGPRRGHRRVKLRRRTARLAAGGIKNDGDDADRLIAAETPAATLARGVGGCGGGGGWRLVGTDRKSTRLNS